MTGDKAVPGLWLMAAATISLLSALSFSFSRKTKIKEALA